MRQKRPSRGRSQQEGRKTRHPAAPCTCSVRSRSRCVPFLAVRLLVDRRDRLDLGWRSSRVLLRTPELAETATDRIASEPVHFWREGAREEYHFGGGSVGPREMQVRLRPCLSCRGSIDRESPPNQSNATDCVTFSSNQFITQKRGAVLLTRAVACPLFVDERGENGRVSCPCINPSTPIPAPLSPTHLACLRNHLHTTTGAQTSSPPPPQQ